MKNSSSTSVDTFIVMVRASSTWRTSSSGSGAISSICVTCTLPRGRSERGRGGGTASGPSGVIEREEELLELHQARLPRERVEDEEHHQDVLVGQDLPAVPLLRFEDLSNSGDELRPEVDGVRVVLVAVGALTDADNANATEEDEHLYGNFDGIVFDLRLDEVSHQLLLEPAVVHRRAAQ